SPSATQISSQSFLLSLPGCHRDLPSFPTRRSSDLTAARTRSPEVSNETIELFSACRSSTSSALSFSSMPRRSEIVLPIPTSLARSEEHTSELQSRENLVCRLLLEKKNTDRHNKRCF